ncbi:MAG: GTPase [Cellulosilyticum sp.]|nr:GTPase [Cellulosilyticum sp.]
MRIPIFLFNGLLEAGKTFFMDYMLKKPVFADGQNTLVIACEEGIEEYDEAYCEKNHITVISVEEEEQFTSALMIELNEKYKPQRVFIEYNGMWDMAVPFEIDYPKDWGIYQVVTLVNAETFNVYINNMRGIMMEHFKCADLVVFNRTSEESNLSSFRNTVKAVNGQAKLFVCDEDFALEPIKEALPYDFTADVIEVADEDYGVWYIDLWEAPQRYMNKKVKVNGLFFHDKTEPKDRFTFGRFAMPCCADDIALMGLYCHNIGKPRFNNKDSIAVFAEIRYEKAEVYNNDMGPILYVKSINLAEKNQEELVVFN